MLVGVMGSSAVSGVHVRLAASHERPILARSRKLQRLVDPAFFVGTLTRWTPNRSKCSSKTLPFESCQAAATHHGPTSRAARSPSVFASLSSQRHCVTDAIRCIWKMQNPVPQGLLLTLPVCAAHAEGGISVRESVSRWNSRRPTVSLTASDPRRHTCPLAMSRRAGVSTPIRSHNNHSLGGS